MHCCRFAGAPRLNLIEAYFAGAANSLVHAAWQHPKGGNSWAVGSGTRRSSGGRRLGKPALEAHVTKPEISGIAPLFIVNNVSAALAFYRDQLGFDITFQGPEPDDIFFGVVQRGAAMIMFKDVGVNPVPNYTRDVKGIARWDAYLHVPDPDALAAEFSSRNVAFSEPLKDTDDGLRGFEVKDADGYVLFFGRPRS